MTNRKSNENKESEAFHDSDKELVKESEEIEELSGIFLAEYKMSNMTMERIVVSNPAILKILESDYQLNEKAQEQVVNDLVDRTPEWEELEQETQVDKIKTVLTQETVLEYLVHTGTIKKSCEMTSIGIDQEGSIVIEAFYTKLNREQRRIVEKSMDDAKKEKMRQAVNIFGGDESLLEKAEEKLKSVQKDKSKVIPFKNRK